MRRRYLREAAIFLFAAQLAVNVLPPTQLFAIAARRAKRVRRFAVDEIEWVSWAIVTIAEKRWTKPCDLACALAAKSMLRRRGISSRICLGVARDGELFVARAWVECNDAVVFGRVDIPRAIRLAQFGEQTQ